MGAVVSPHPSSNCQGTLSHITEIFPHVTQKVKKPYHISCAWELSELGASVTALGVQAQNNLWGFVQWKLPCAGPVAVPWKNNFSCLQACAVTSQAIYNLSLIFCFSADC